MPYGRGRTINPTSGKMTFVIDENVQFSGPQNWDQLWTCCEGPEPIVDSGKADADRALIDQAYIQLPIDYDSLSIALRNAAFLDMAISEEPETTEGLDAIDIERNRCQNHRRTVTVTMVALPDDETGDAVLISKMQCGGRAIIAEIAIRLETVGRNPSRAQVSAALGNDILRAIAWQESRWRQFDGAGKPLVNRNTNGTADWGIMQINGAANYQKWDWRANVARGAAILAEKQGHATTYLNRHGSYTPEMLENEMLQRYNGGAYHKWDAANSQWVARPPNGYVASVRAIIDAKPW